MASSDNISSWVLELFMTTIVTISDDFVVINSIVFAMTLISSLKNFFVTTFV